MKQRWPYGFAAVAALALCGALFGARVIDPRRIDWLTIGDRATHHLGWMFFRDAPWRWPLGDLPDYMHPVGTRIAATDSIPLVAFALKPFSPLLPARFQYFGLWIVACYVLQGITAVRLLRRVTMSAPAVAAGALLFVASPVLFARFQQLGHSSLCAQFLLLLGMDLCLAARGRRGAAQWLGLLGLASLVHPYLTAMLIVLLVGWSWREGAEIPRWRAIARGLALLAAALLLVGLSFVAQGWTRPSQLPFEGFGAFSSDLTALVNPLELSMILPALPTARGQHEGFAYLGLGALALSAIAVVAGRGQRWLRLGGLDARPLALCCALMAGFALSSSIRCRGVEWLDLGAAYAPFTVVVGALRSSGRFVWPLHYFVLLWAIARVAPSDDTTGAGRWSPRSALALLMGCVALQGIDLLPAFALQAMRRRGAPSPLVSPVWRRLGRHARHLVLVPPQFYQTRCDSPAYQRDYYVPFAMLAAEQGMTINSGYSARPDLGQIADYCQGMVSRAVAGAIGDDEAWILGPTMKLPPPGGRLLCARVDGIALCVDGRRRDPLAEQLRGAAPPRPDGRGVPR